MKEAAGEANMTVVTIVLIAAVVAIATPIITSSVRVIGKRNCCQAAGGSWNGKTCDISDYWDDANNRCANS